MKNIILIAGLFGVSHAFAQQSYFRLCFSNSCGPEYFTVEIEDSTGNGTPLNFQLFLLEEANSNCYFNNFTQVISPINISVNAELPGDVTYPDVIRLTRHLTGAEPFTDPYQWIAADIDKNNIVDSTDRQELINYIIGTYTEFPNNSFWRFYPDTFMFVNPAAPLDQPIPTVFTLPFPADTIELNLKAVQIGDVDMSGCTVSSTNTPAPATTVLVYPNPVSEVLHIWAGSIENDLQIILYDQLGRFVYTGLNSSATSGIPVSNYTPGVYFLQVRDHQQIIHNQTITIQK